MIKKNKIIVYSVNIGGYDEIKTPKTYDPNVEYILFTDDESVMSEVWKIYPIDFVDSKLDNRRKSRYLKLNSHLVLPEHDISIYVDNCFEPLFDDVNKLLEEINFGNLNMMAYKHRERICTYVESHEVLKLNLDSKVIVNNQMKRYHNMGFPTNYGLYENGFLIRRNNLKIKFFNEAWWKELSKNSARDQLSQMFTSWLTGVDLTPILVGDNVYSNPFLSKTTTHKKRWATLK
jgi:hypothetical protein